MQQPVVSKMLKNLEESLEQPLFWKKGRNKSLTDYGQLVFRHSQVVFNELNKIQQVSTDPLEVKGVFNLGAAEPIINFVLGPLFSKFMSQFPNLHSNVYVSTQTQLLNMISDGKLDMGFLFYAPNITKDLEIVKSIPYRFHTVVKKSFVNDKNVLESFIGSREVDDLSTHSFPTVELLRKKRPKTRITFSSNSISLHKQMVMNGKGVACLPNFMVEKELARGQLIDLFPKKNMQWDMMVIKKKSDYFSQSAQTFLKML